MLMLGVLNRFKGEIWLFRLPTVLDLGQFFKLLACEVVSESLLLGCQHCVFSRCQFRMEPIDTLADSNWAQVWISST